jgi:hypothetical protein
MALVNRRRRLHELPLLPSLSVDIVRGVDRLRPIRASVDRLTAETVIVTCDSGIDALAVAMSPDLELTFRGPGLEVSTSARPGRRVDDVHGNRSVELVLDESVSPHVRLLA